LRQTAAILTSSSSTSKSEDEVVASAEELLSRVTVVDVETDVVLLEGAMLSESYVFR
jgi:hypothetical protein